MPNRDHRVMETPRGLGRVQTICPDRDKQLRQRLEKLKVSIANDCPLTRKNVLAMCLCVG